MSRMFGRSNKRSIYKGGRNTPTLNKESKETKSKVERLMREGNSTLLELANQNVFVATAINYIIKNMVNKQIVVSKNGKELSSFVDGNYNKETLYKLLNIAPSSHTTKESFISTIILNLIFNGNCYVIIQRDDNGFPTELSLVDKKDIKISYSGEDNEYNFLSEVIYEYKDIKIEPNNILHLKIMSEETVSLFGVPIIKSLYNTLADYEDIANGFIDSAKNSSKGTFVENIKDSQNSSAIQRARVNFNNQMANSTSDITGHNYFAIDRGSEIRYIDTSSKSTGSVGEARKDMIKEIATAFQVSVEIFKLELVNTSSEVEQGKEEDAIEPYVNAIVSELNKKLFYNSDDVYEFEFKNKPLENIE